MPDAEQLFEFPPHDHVFLGEDHDRAERRTWAVIILCTIMMIAEIVGGALFGSLALIADGLHMSTHAGALLLAALAYSYARKYANDRRFSFGTGKFGDLAGYSSAIVLAMIALLIGYEAVSRLLEPIPISFNEAIPIAVLGLAVNVISAWLLSGGHHHDHDHGHAHGHGHGHAHNHGRDRHSLVVQAGRAHQPNRETEEHEHAHEQAGHHRDNNMRAAVLHVLADAAVSVLVIIGLVLARTFGWLWMDPLAGFIGALVIANWSIGLLRDTGAILLDRTPDPRMAERVRSTIEAEGDRVTDLHLWRLGPGHLGAIVSVATAGTSEAAHYRRRLARFADLSHVTVEVQHIHPVNG
jgi:cation diffusion facilitator family transporter